MKFNPLPYVVCVFMWTIGVCDSSSSGDSERTCHRVRREFFHKRIGKADLVPDSPIHDPAVSICYNAEKEKDRKSCCSHQSEQKYVVAAEKYLKNSIRTKNAFIKKQIMDHISTYQERIHGLLQISENSTRQLLSDIYKIPHEEYDQPVHDLFSEIRQYMKHIKHYSVYGIVSEFFNRIFPAVYKNSLSDGNVIELSEEHQNCLKSKRPEIVPPPFGLLPFNMSQNLYQVLSVAKSYLDVLSLMVEVINSTDHLAINKKCNDQMTQLQFCSHCDGYVDTKPCKGFCLNVMRGCLSPLSILTPDWEELVISLTRLEGGMSRKYDIEKILGNINQRIDGAVMYAMENEHNYDQSMKALCNFQVKTKSPDQLLKSDSTASHHKRNKHQRHHQAPLNKRSLTGESDDFYNQFMQVMKKLLSSAKMFDTISNDICDQELFYNQDQHSEFCWNGTTVGRYTPMVEGLTSFSKAINIEMDPKIATLKEKLSQMKLNLQTRYSDRELMFSDSDSAVNYGSGDYLTWKKVSRAQPSDDEDMNGSGSGGYSVEGSGIDPDPPVIKPQDPGTDPTDQIEIGNQPETGNQGSKAHHVIPSTFTIFVVIATIAFL